MENINQKIGNDSISDSWGKLCFICGVTIICVGYVWTFSELSNLSTYNIDRYSTYLGIFFLGLSILSKRTISRTWLLLLIVGVPVGLISYLNSQDKTFLLIVMIVLSSKDISFRSIMKMNLALIISAFSSIVILMLLGVLPNTVYVRGSDMRYSLGFMGFGQVSFLIFFFFIVFSLFQGKNFKFASLIFGLIVASIDYFITYDKTTTALIVLVAFLFFLANRSIGKWLSNLFSRLAVIIFPLGFFISYMLSKLYNGGSNNWLELDKLLNSRLTLGHTALLSYPLKLLGQNIPQIGLNGFDDLQLSGLYKYFYIDSAYLRILLMSGILALIWLACYFILLGIHLFKERDIYLAIIVLVICLYGIVNQYMIQASFNLVFVLLFSRKESIHKDSIQYSEERGEMSK